MREFAKNLRRRIWPRPDQRSAAGGNHSSSQPESGSDHPELSLCLLPNPLRGGRHTWGEYLGTIGAWTSAQPECGLGDEPDMEFETPTKAQPGFEATRGLDP